MNLRIALTGGIGTGKSTAAEMLVARGAHLIDADVLARTVVEPGTPALAEIAEVFGAAVLTDSGALDRAALAEIVFSSESRRRRLNRIVHPAIRRASAEQRRAIRAQDPCAVILEDIPLLSDPQEAARFHAVIVIHAPLDLRLERLETRGMTLADARARIDAQSSDAQRFRIADALLANDGTLEHLEGQIDHLWHRRLLPYSDAIHGRIPPPAPRPGNAEEITRARARLQRALAKHQIQVEVQDAAGGLVLSVDHPDLAHVLASGGFVAIDPQTYVCADPGAPIGLFLR